MSEIIREHFADTSYNLAKALHFNEVSKQYFELLKIGSKGETKMLFSKQFNLFGKPEEEEKKYSSKIEAPVYEPKNKKPHLLELVNKSKTQRLMKEIENSNLPYEEKMFLMDAARRHNVFKRFSTK